jgi:Domain of unknown function (DUF1648)
MRDSSRIAFIIALLLCIGQAVYYYPLLPDRVASHFGISGLPDAWSNKGWFVGTYLFTVASTSILFFGMVPMLKRIPDTFISLPNKGYWLSPEHREGTLKLLSRQFLWFGTATLLLLLDIFHQSFNVHLGNARGLEHPVASMVIYIAFTIIWGISLIATYKRLP